MYARFVISISPQISIKPSAILTNATQSNTSSPVSPVFAFRVAYVLGFGVTQSKAFDFLIWLLPRTLCDRFFQPDNPHSRSGIFQAICPPFFIRHSKAARKGYPLKIKRGGLGPQKCDQEVRHRAHVWMIDWMLVL